MTRTANMIILDRAVKCGNDMNQEIRRTLILNFVFRSFLLTYILPYFHKIYSSYIIK